MKWLSRLLVIVFAESMAGTLAQNGVMFLTHSKLGFTERTNLYLTLAMGAMAVLGALVSHRLTRRIGERRLALRCLAGQVLICGALAFCAVQGTWLNPTTIFIGASLVTALGGVKWPIIESYVTAGREPAQIAKAIGWFNLSWSIGIPAALLPSGMLISAWSPGLFVVAGLFSSVSIFISRSLPARPEHLRLPAATPEGLASARRIESLLGFSRWQLLGGYSLLWMLNPLMPEVFQTRLHLDVTWQTILASGLYLARMVAFLVLGHTDRWHGRFSPLAASAVMLPAGFLLIVFAPHWGVVVLGELFCGAAGGLIYYAALYYAMVATNASVEGGGTHEGLINLGSILGPTSALLGRGVLVPALGGLFAGTLVGIAPLLLVSAYGSLRYYLRFRATQSAR